MGSRFGLLITALVTASIVAVIWLTVLPLSGQQVQPARQGTTFPPYRAPRLVNGHPDLNGVWQAMVTANIDLQDHEAQSGPYPELLGAYGGWPAGQSIVDGGE